MADEGKREAGRETEKQPGGQASRRVAVIGVHGVAHHDPGATANAMADLLLSLPSYRPDQDLSCHDRPAKLYDHFRAVPIQVPLQPVCVERGRVQASPVRRGVQFLQEGSAEFARAISPPEGREARGEQDIGNTFTAQLLQDYQGGADGNAYPTTRLEGKRSDTENVETEVHIYEVFWADLARPTNSALSFLLALFQFILHVPSLSRLAIDTRPGTGKLWKVFQFMQRYASRMLQIFIPLAQVVLLIALFSATPAILGAKNLRLVAAICGAVVAAIIVFLLANLLRRPTFNGRIPWLLVALVPGLVVAAVIFYFVQAGWWNQDVVLAVTLWVVGAGLLWYALEAYDDLRPGVRLVGWLAYAIFLALFLFYAFCLDSSDSIQKASLWTSQWLFVMLRFFWLLLTSFAILAFALGGLAWRREPNAQGCCKARAAVRTSRLALAMPSFLFVVVTGLIWAGLFGMADRIHQPYFCPKVLSVAPGLNWLEDVHKYDFFPHLAVADIKCPGAQSGPCPAGETTYPYCTASPQCPDYLRGVLAWSVGYGILIAFLLTLTGLFILLWWAVPAVLTEKFPLRERYRLTQKKIGTEPPRSSTNAESVWMGAWLSRGLDSTSLVTLLTWVAIFLAPPAFFYAWSWRAWFEHTTALIVCRAIAVAASVAILASIVHYTSPVLRVILDVDTYLRTGPKNASPRARIFERYVSLLRHVARYQERGRGYDAVVIVAHSLGSVISADLLRFLHHNASDPELSMLGYGPPADRRIPIKLFTMGNPLRQLLNRFFPYLYDWVRSSPDNGSTPLPPPLAQPPQNLDAVPPDPADLGVEVWANAYRSGDYVGRSLWLDEWYRRTATGTGIYPEPVQVVREDNRRAEMCIGAGAHTHYWDDTAPDIASQLNQLI
jgi:hypothetical protein